MSQDLLQAFSETKDQATTYLSEQADLYKLEAIEKTSQVSTMVISGILVLILIGITLFFLSGAFCVFLAQSVFEGNFVWAFLSVAGFNLLLALLVFVLRGALIRNVILRKMVKMLFVEKQIMTEQPSEKSSNHDEAGTSSHQES